MNKSLLLGISFLFTIPLCHGEIIFSNGDVFFTTNEKPVLLAPYSSSTLPTIDAYNNTGRLIQQTNYAHAWSMSEKNQPQNNNNLWLVMPSYNENLLVQEYNKNHLNNRQQTQRNLRRAHAFRLELYKK